MCGTRPVTSTPGNAASDWTSGVGSAPTMRRRAAGMRRRTAGRTTLARKFTADTFGGHDIVPTKRMIGSAEYPPPRNVAYARVSTPFGARYTREAPRLL